MLFLVVGSTVAYILPKRVSHQSKKQLDKSKDEQIKHNRNDRVVLVESPADALNVRLELIQNSARTLDIVYHTMHDSASTDVFLGEVFHAAERGVTVRILIDGKLGAPKKSMRDKLRALNSHSNISYRVYNPANFLKPWEFHALLHDKMIVVDNQYLLLGGRNIGDRYFGPAGYARAITNDRDAFVWSTDQTRHSVVSQAQKYLNTLWNSPHTEAEKSNYEPWLVQEMVESMEPFAKRNPKFFVKTLEDYKASTVTATSTRLIHNPINNSKKEPWVALQLRELADQADHSVLLQSPYNTGNKHLLQTLQRTAARVPVTLLTNSMGSSPNLPAFSNYYSQRRKFLATGIRIFEYQNYDSIHAKSMVFDDRISAVGSFNTDDRSMYLSTETMLIIDSEPFAEQLNDAIHRQMATSLEVGLNNRYIKNPDVEQTPVPLIKRMMMFATSVFSRAFQFLM